MHAGISTYVRPSNPSRVVVEVEQAAGAKGTIARRGNSLVYTFTGGAAQHSMQSGVASDGGTARRTRTVARDAEPEGALKVETSFADEAEGTGAPVASGGAGVVKESTSEPSTGPTPSCRRVAAQQRRFNGRRIDLDLKDADIHNILRLLADVGRVNIVTADDVAGQRHDPHAQRALGSGARRRAPGQGPRHGAQRQPDPRRAARRRSRRSASCAIAAAKQELELAPLETRLIPVSYAQADELQARAKDLLSPRGSIAVDERTNVLIARDVAGNLNNIEELVRSLDTQTPQVLVEARIVEATSRYLRDVGIQWGGDATFSRGDRQPDRASRSRRRVGVAGGDYDQNTPTARSLAVPGATSRSRTSPSTSRPRSVPDKAVRIGFSLGSIDNNFNLGLRLSAAEASGHAPHRLEPAHPHARQPRRAHQPGHAHPVLAGQRAGRADHVPGSEAAAPRAAARHRRRLASRCT